MNAPGWRPREGAVLVTWLAYTSEPFLRNRPGFHRYVTDKESGEKIPGPLLSALLEAESPLRGRLSAVYLFWRDAPPTADKVSEKTVLAETLAALKDALGDAAPPIRPVAWDGTDPTDHRGILAFAEGQLRKIRRDNPSAQILLHTSPGTKAMSNVFFLLGTTGFVDDIELVQGIPKRERRTGDPTLRPLKIQIDSYLRRFRGTHTEPPANEDAAQLLDPVQARSPALKEVYRQLDRWAPLKMPVLLIGERGTGKTTFALYLRSIGPFQKKNANESWPVVVCGQFRVDVTSARSELFGHVKGAFTGATGPREGLLKRADGDCLFLDEIGDIDRDTQRLLVAALEGRGFSPLGSSELERSSFRLICATNRPLELLAGGILDEDFLDRISYATVRIPPLRECREDLPYLWATILNRARRHAEVDALDIEEATSHPELLSLLQRAPLRGNLRDLYRLAYAVLAALKAGDDWGELLRGVEGIFKVPSPAPGSGALPEISTLRALLPLTQSVKEAYLKPYQRRWAEAAMEEAGTQTDAAALLHIPTRTLAGWLAPRAGGPSEGPAKNRQDSDKPPSTATDT